MQSTSQENTLNALVLKEFWDNRLKQMMPVQLGFSSINEVDGRREQVVCTLPENTGKQFANVTKGKQVNAYKIGLAALYILLHKYTKETKLTVVSSLPEFEQLLSVQNDLIVSEVVCNKQETIKSLLGKIHQDFLTVVQHADFDVVNLFHKMGKSEGFYAGLQLEGFTRDLDLGTMVALLFSIVEKEHEVTIQLDFDTTQLSLENANQLLLHFTRILDSIVFNLELTISDVRFVTEKEVLSPLTGKQITEQIDFQKGFVERVEEVVDKKPEQIAVNCEGETISYKALNERANQWCHYLVERGLRPGERVGIVGGRSIEQVIQVLAVLKAGCAYVPVDSTFPLERKKSILADSDSRFLLVKEKQLAEGLENVVCIVDALDAGNYSTENPGIKPDPDDLLYIMFSSGTTGKPKGIMVNHKSILNLLLWYEKKYAIDQNTRIVQITNLTIDIAFQEIFSSLLAGATLFVPSMETSMNKSAFLQYLEANGITFIQVIPDLLKTYFLEEEKLKSLDYVLCGGDKLNDQLRDQIVAKGYNLFNVYGQTETAIDSVISNCTAGLTFDEAIQGYDLYVLNEELHYVLPGTVGQICTGGVGLGIGYLNDPEQTSEKFIDNPNGEGRLYLTGDLGRRMSDGTIQFIGREDNQVKIRGYRIELAEVEKALLRYEPIEDAVVTVITDDSGENSLVGYYISKENPEIDGIRTFLRSVVPDYMVPIYFVRMERFPISDNGKVKKNELPLPDFKGATIDTDYCAPETQEEIAVVEAIQEVLKRDKVSVNHNFYDLGGDSIKSILVVSKLKQLGFNLKVEDILKIPVLKELAATLRQETVSIDQSEWSGDADLTPIQSFFFNDAGLVAREHYNQSLVLKMNAQYVVNLEQAMRCLMSHHDILRAVYEEKNGAWKQTIKPSDATGISVEHFNLVASENTKEEIERLGNQLQSGFDLSEGPLIKVGVFQCSDAYRVLLVAHHLIIDGLSWRILLEDLETLLTQIQAGENPQLPLKTDTYGSWSDAQRAYYSETTREKERNYWSAQSTLQQDDFWKDETFLNRFKTNGRIAFKLDVPDTQRALTTSHKAFGTDMNDLLLTALGLALKDTFGAESTMIRMEGHGREDVGRNLDVSRTVGWFTSIYPFLLDIQQCSNDPLKALVAVKDSMRRIPNKGIGYGILRFIENTTLAFETPKVEFNYLGSFDQDKENGIFEVLDESAGNAVSLKNNSETALNISGIHMNDQLELSMEYAQEVFDDSTMELLAGRYKKALISLLDALEAEPEGQLTPSDLTFKDLTVAELEILNKNKEVEDVYGLSPLQEGIYFHWSLSRDSTQYVNQTSYRVTGEQNVKLIERSYAELVERHAALRTGFTEQFAGRVLQVVRKSVAPNFEFVDGQNQQFDLLQFKAEERTQGFNLNDASLMRLTIVQLAIDDFEFIWSSHHILMDGWCVSILINDFVEILGSHKLGKVPQLNTPKPYSEYIKWLAGVDQQASVSYWKELLDGYQERAIVPSQFKNLENRRVEEKEITDLIGDELFQTIDLFCRNASITLSTFLQGAWGYLLATYNYSRDVVYGSVVSGRPAVLDGVDEMIGLFINTIPIRVTYAESDTPLSLLKNLQKQSIEGNSHHYMNLADVQSQSSLGRNLMDHIMVIENYAVKESSEEMKSQLSVSAVEVLEETNYDFNLIFGPGSDALSVQIKYNSRLYSQEFIQETLNRFKSVVTQFVQNPQTELKSLHGMSQHDLLRISQAGGYGSYPQDMTITKAFSKHVKETPSSVAVRFKEKTLTYQQLDVLSNQLANYIHTHYAINTDDLITIKLERSEWLLVAILAVLKSGAAYVPVDPGYPEERISYIEKDAGSKISIDQKLLNNFYLEKDQLSESYIGANSKPSDLAYIIYTSGTTGNPKGVQIEHSNVIQLLFNSGSIFDFNNSDVWTLFHSYCFDFSVWEMYGALLFGGELVVVPEETTKDVEQFAELLQRSQVTVLNLTPSVFKILQEQIIKAEINNRIRFLIFGGEALYPEFLTNWRKKFESCQLVNMYGITETSVVITYKEITDEDIRENTCNIGKPLPTLKAHVFGIDGQPVPEGIPGELYVSGHGLGRGYLNREELTKERFIWRELNGVQERLYRSGDLVRGLPDNELEYLGRIDDQVKIRGYRIELGEVSNALKKQPSIKDAVVVAWGNDANKYLYAYYLSDSAVSEDALFEFMKHEVPSYMIPSGFEKIAVLPVTKNGKLDKSKLPAPQFQKSMEYVSPENELQEKLVQIWSELLQENPEQIGINHHFFDAGANSLTVTKLSLRVKNELNCEMSLADIFERPVLKDQATFISNKQWLQEEITEDLNLNEIEI